MTDSPSFVFVFPYRGVGGVNTLFLRLAERLSRKNIKVALVDYPDGAMATGRGEGTLLIPYYDDQPVALPEDAILVFQAMTPWSIFQSLKIDPKQRLFFWNCHPFNLVPTLPGLRAPMQGSVRLGKLILRTLLRSYRRRMIRFTCFLLKRKALIFMDQPNLTNTESYLDLDLGTQEFLPVFAGDPKPSPLQAGKPVGDTLRLAWIGRIADFKIHILRRALSDLDKLQPKLGRPILFVIVGSGAYDAELRADAKNWPNLDIDFRGEMPLPAIADFLKDEVDVLLAMGTSALEAASIGVPVILLDVAYVPVPEGYRYTWLHERRGYTLGDVLTLSDAAVPNDSLKDRLQNFMKNPDAERMRNLQYYKDNHAPEAVVERFMAAAGTTGCTYSDFVAEGFVRPDPLYAIFDATRRVLRK